MSAYRTRAYTRVAHEARHTATTVRIRALVFSLIANRPVFSIFKGTLVPRICYLSTTLLVPTCPLFLPACPCLHLEEVEQPASTNTLIFSSLSVRILPAATYDIVNWVFSRNATGISRYLRLTGMHKFQFDLSYIAVILHFHKQKTLVYIYIFFSYIMSSYFFTLIFILARFQRNRVLTMHFKILFPLKYLYVI